MNKRKIIIPIVLLLAGAAIAWRVFASRGSDPNRIVVHGNIELTEVDLSFKLSGRLIELAVDEGAYVKKGQVLARLDKVELENQRDREIAGRTAAESNLAQLQTGIRFQKESIAGDLELKRADLRQAEARLSELARRLAAPGDRAGAGRGRAKPPPSTNLPRWIGSAPNACTRTMTSPRRSSISTALVRVHARRPQARAGTLSLVKEGPRKEQIAAARAAVDRGRAAVRLAEANQIELSAASRRPLPAAPRSPGSEAQVTVVRRPDRRPGHLCAHGRRGAGRKARNPARCSPPGPPSSPSATSTIPGCAATSTSATSAASSSARRSKVTTDSYPGKKLCRARSPSSPRRPSSRPSRFRRRRSG